MSKRIGLFGGTFDPVHYGHIALVNSFLGSHKIDELWVLLTPVPPHKQDKEHASFDDRKHMLDLAFKNDHRVSISTVEQDLPKPSYTIRTLRYLLKQHQNVKFYLCIGEDSLANFDKWKDHRDILDKCDLLVAERPDVSHEHVDKEIMNKVHFVEHEPLEVSSTSVRSLISDSKSVKHLLTPKVYKYIMANNLYQ